MSPTQKEQAENKNSPLLPRELSGSQARALRLTVLFTTIPATLAALRKAASLASQLGATIQILVIQTVPYPLPLDAPAVKPEFRLRQFHALWDREQIETLVDIRLCRDARQCIHSALAPHSLVLIGERKTWQPLTREKRLIRSLKKAGHEVVPVGPW